jgi:hypothetical protein
VPVDLSTGDRTALLVMPEGVFAADDELGRREALDRLAALVEQRADPETEHLFAIMGGRRKRESC